MKKSLLLLVITVLSFVVIGCNKDEASTTPTPAGPAGSAGPKANSGPAVGPEPTPIKK